MGPPDVLQGGFQIRTGAGSQTGGNWIMTGPGGAGKRKLWIKMSIK